MSTADDFLARLSRETTAVELNASYYEPNIERATLDNTAYRRVLHTNSAQQLVLMHLQPGESIPLEVHPRTGQFIRVERGAGVAVLSGFAKTLTDGSVILVAPGTHHGIRADADGPGLWLYTIYSALKSDWCPPHERGLVQETRGESEHD